MRLRLLLLRPGDSGPLVGECLSAASESSESDNEGFIGVVTDCEDCPESDISCEIFEIARKAGLAARRARLRRQGVVVIACSQSLSAVLTASVSRYGGTRVDSPVTEAESGRLVRGPEHVPLTDLAARVLQPIASRQKLGAPECHSAVGPEQEVTRGGREVHGASLILLHRLKESCKRQRWRVVSRFSVDALTWMRPHHISTYSGQSS